MSLVKDMDELTKKYEKLLQESDEWKRAGDPNVSINLYPGSQGAVREQLTPASPSTHPTDTPESIAAWGKRVSKSIRLNEKDS